jgi:hypothetical protein
MDQMWPTGLQFKNSDLVSDLLKAEKIESWVSHRPSEEVSQELEAELRHEVYFGPQSTVKML